MAAQHDTRFEDHFPIAVMVSHHAGVDDINREVFEIVHRLREQYIDDAQENAALSGSITTYGGYQTSKNMMFLNRPEPSVRSLVEEVIQPGVARSEEHTSELQSPKDLVCR